MNIVDAAQQKGLQMKLVGKTTKRGPEYAGPCPVCGGDDRFRICPEHGTKGGSYFCRQCGIKGDCISFLREYSGLSFADAALEVGMQVAGKKGRSPAPIIRPPRRAEPAAGGDYTYPPEAWSDKAEALVQHLRGSADNIDRAVRYLAGRGISADTSAQHGIVWNPLQYFRHLSTWGLPEEQKIDGSSVRLYIPSGLVIPVRAGGRIIRLRVRRESGDPRYLAIKGSSVEPLVVRSHERCLVVVEAELDGLLIQQLAGDLVSVMATGSTTVRPSACQIEAVRQFPLILLAFDNDGPGDHACQWWLQELRQAQRFEPAGGKDPGEAPHLVRQWIADKVSWGVGAGSSRPGGNSADFLKKKQEGEGVHREIVRAGSSRPIPQKCRGCWAQMPEGDMCCRDVAVMPITEAIKNCEY